MLGISSQTPASLTASYLSCLAGACDRSIGAVRLAGGRECALKATIAYAIADRANAGGVEAVESTVWRCCGVSRAFCTARTPQYNNVQWSAIHATVIPEIKHAANSDPVSGEGQLQDQS